MSKPTNKSLQHIEHILTEGRVQQARLLCEQACDNDSGNVPARILLGKIEGICGNYRNAVEHLKLAISIAPGNSAAHYFHGLALYNLDSRDDAIRAFTQAMVTTKGSALYIQLANAFRQCGDTKNTQECCTRILKEDPHNKFALDLLGRTCAKTGDISRSVKSYRTLVNAYPDDINAHCNLGEQLLTIRNCKMAEPAFRNALAIKEDDARAHRGLAFALDNLGHLTDAESHYRKSLEIDPENINTISGLAYILQRRGLYEEAFKLLDPLIEKNVLNASAAYTYAWICDRFSTCRKAINYTESVLGRNDLDLSNRTMLSFSLGKLYDKQGAYENAFSWFSNANRLRKDTFDINQTKEKFKELIGFYTADTLSALPRARQQRMNIIYIVGMPRSGTSLVEQILASHPFVHGGGELESVTREVNSLSKIPGLHGAYPECMKHITIESLELISDRISSRINTIGSNVKYATDKTPINFIHLGFISLLNPDTRIIHCLRDPLDTCLSCYFQDFIGAAYGFTNSLESLGAYYNEYRRLMEHWLNILAGNIHNVHYEALVANPEKEVHAMLDHCGLPWHEGCLRFYDSNREVKTSSFTQVRKPIYTKSVGRHRNYAKHIIGLGNMLNSYKQDRTT